jgi:hypothetical protein
MHIAQHKKNNKNCFKQNVFIVANAFCPIQKTIKGKQFQMDKSTIIDQSIRMDFPQLKK